MSDSKTPSPNGEGAPRRRAGAERNAAPDAAAIGSRRRQYLIAPRTVASTAGPLQPMSTDQIADALNSIEGVSIVRRLKPKAQGFGTLSTGAPGTGLAEVIVAEADVDRGEHLRLNAPPHVIIEHNALLQHADEGLDPFRFARSSVAATVIAPQNVSVDLRLQVVGGNGEPLADALVIVYGNAFPAQGSTDANGLVQLTVYGTTAESLTALYVKPKANHWERFVTRPVLDPNNVNTVALRPLTQSFPDFPRTRLQGWGPQLMGLDKLASQYTGRGVKIGIIDSGCDRTHPQLTQVANGLDFTNDRNATTWADDTVFHGTHCAGVIAGNATQGIRGFAPEAEVHALKVFPGGRFDSLIDALDECIAREIDVVNLSLGSDQVSEIVANKIAEARQRGVACIVAAGNSAGPVQFPALLPSVLAVSALGKLGEYPPDTNHAQTVLPATLTPAGLFGAKFSCYGPQIGVGGPGVAIVSCIPGGGYAAWDGTSMATPHITGLAALLLAHHTAFRTQYAQRNEARVAALFQLLQSTAAPAIADVTRQGSGLPQTTSIQVATTPAQPAAPTAQQQFGQAPTSAFAPSPLGWYTGQPLGSPLDVGALARALVGGSLGAATDPRQLPKEQQAWLAAALLDPRMQSYLQMRALGLVT